MVPNVASSNLVTRPINKKRTKRCGFLFIWSGQIRTGGRASRTVGERQTEVCRFAKQTSQGGEAIWSPDADFHRSDKQGLKIEHTWFVSKRNFFNFCYYVSRTGSPALETKDEAIWSPTNFCYCAQRAQLKKFSVAP